MGAGMGIARNARRWPGPVPPRARAVSSGVISTTRFRSDRADSPEEMTGREAISGDDRLRRYGLAGLLLLVPVLLGCSAGRPSAGFVNARLMDAYIPLSERRVLIFNRWAAGFAIAPNVGVTNDHNLALIPPERVLARSRDYD